MEADEILGAMRNEHELLCDVIACFERIAAGNTKRRGRPPKWAQTAKAAVAVQPVRKRGRPRKIVDQRGAAVA